MHRPAGGLVFRIRLHESAPVPPVPGHPVPLPLRARPAASQTLFDYLAVCLDVVTIDIKQSQPLARQWQELLQEQLAQATLPAIQPLDRRGHAATRRGVEIVARDDVRYAELDLLALHERSDETEEEGRIRHFVCMGRAGRHAAVLDADVRYAIAIETDERSRPAPQGAIVQPQVGELLQQDGDEPGRARCGPRGRRPRRCR